MSKSTKLITNVTIVGVVSIFSVALALLWQRQDILCQIAMGILLAITIFILALSLTKDSSLPTLLSRDGRKGEGILKGIPFLRFFIAIIVYVLFDVCAFFLPQVATLAIEGGDITFPMLLSAAYEAMKWYSVFLILSIKAEKPVNASGMVIAFVLPFLIILAKNALQLHNFHIIVNSGGGLITTMNRFIFNKFSQNNIVSMILQFCFTAVIPIIYVIIGHLMRKKASKKS